MRNRTTIVRESLSLPTLLLWLNVKQFLLLSAFLVSYLSYCVLTDS
nr:MAG TPA: hypothetical protein [Caudoviricetes sp.]